MTKIGEITAPIQTESIEQQITKTQYTTSFKGYNVDNVPENDEFVSKKKKKNTVAWIVGAITAATLIFGGIVYHKGGAEGVEKKFSERMQDGWKKIFNKAENIKEEVSKKSEETLDKSKSSEEAKKAKEAEETRIAEEATNEEAGETVAKESEKAGTEATNEKAGETVAKEGEKAGTEAVKEIKCWDDVLSAREWSEDDIKCLNKLSNDEKAKVTERNLLDLTDANGDAFWGGAICDFAKLTDDEFAKIKSRKLLKLKRADGKAFFGFEICDFAKLIDNKFAKIKSRKLLELKRADGEAFFGYAICNFAKLTDEEFARIDTRQLLKWKYSNGETLSSSDICRLTQYSEEEFSTIESRKLREFVTGLDNYIAKINAYLKMTEDEFNIAKARKLEDLRFANGDSIKFWDLKNFVKLTEDEFAGIKSRNLMSANAKGEYYSGYSVCKLAELTNEEYSKIAERNLYEYTTNSGRHLRGFEMAECARYTEYPEWQDYLKSLD